MEGNLSIHEEERSAIHTRYKVNFYDDVIYVCVTDHPEMVARSLEILETQHRGRLNRLIVGLEVIWRRNGYHVSILQLCVGDRCLIFQIFSDSEIPQKLCEFLADERYTFVGVDIQNDVEILFRDHRLLVGGRIFDLSTLLDERHLDVGFSVLDVITTLLTRLVSRPLWILSSYMWDWSQLDPDRIMYACLDPFVSSRIGQLLLNASGDS